MATKVTKETVSRDEVTAEAAAAQARVLSGEGEPDKNMVRYRLPVDMANIDDAVFVAVNGESYMIKRGEWVEIPDYIATVLDRSQEADFQTERRIQNAVSNPIITEVH